MGDKNERARTGDSTSYPAWIPAQKDDLPEAGEVLDPGCDRRADISEPPSGQCGGQSRERQGHKRDRSQDREPGRLSAKRLAAWNAWQRYLRWPPHTGVKAYTVGGQQCCMEEYEALTLPGMNEVKYL